MRSETRTSGPAAPRRRPFLAAIGAAAATVLMAAGASAQPSVQLNRFSPTEQAQDGFVTRSAETLGHMRWNAQLYLDYANDPLVFEQSRRGETVGFGVVQHQLTGNLSLALGLTDHLTVFAGVPVVLHQKGGGIPGALLGVVDGDGNSPTGVPVYLADGAGLGDVFVGARGNFYGTTDDIFMLGGSARFTLPTANLADGNQHFRGEQSLSAWPELLMQLNLGRIRAMANVGGIFRDKARDCETLSPVGRGAGSECFSGNEVGHELTYALGGTLRLLDAHDLRGTVEVHGRSNFAHLFDGNQTPLELLLGLKYASEQGFNIGAGGGPGLVKGLGSPDFRLFGMIGYTSPAAPTDADQDGLLDDADRCPTEAEDMDGFEDEDGCPELDNDGDAVADAADACPLAAEDMDGFEDEDGCPEPDNDGDGVADVDDQCPLEAEDTDGFADEDGCPELDNDQDGVADADDKCPNDAGVADNGGCPIVDADGDGIADKDDSCPNEAGTAEFNGCAKAATVKVGKEKLEFTDNVYFESGLNVIQARSFELLDNVARVLKEHPELNKVRVEGHSDATGALAYNMELSERRAQAVKDYLVEQGVSAERLEAKGYGPTRPLIKNAKKPWERAKNRRVEFTIIEGASTEEEAAK